MFKKSIFSKLFFMNLTILFFIAICQLVFQFFYFEKYYIGEKEEILRTKSNEFEEFINNEHEPKKIMDYVQKVSKRDNVVISLRNTALQDVYPVQYYMASPTITITSDNGQDYKIVLEEYLKDLNIKQNDVIEIEGYVNEYDYIFPISIKINNKKVDIYSGIVPKHTSKAIDSMDALTNSHWNKQVYIKGKSKGEIEADNPYFLLNLKLNDIITQDYNISRNILTRREFCDKVYDSSTNYNNLIYTKNLNSYIITAITPLSQVNEVVGVMNSFYVYVFLITVFLVIIVSFIYSKIISRPLIDMSNIAYDISNFRFNSKYKVKSQDEIGKLGDALNKISSNLEEALTELKQANTKLMEDFNNQKLQEEKRKEFIANISHELKTPITIIQGYINGMQKGLYSKEKCYDDILDETIRLNDLVKEMLDISKLESPNFKLKQEPFDLWSLFLKQSDKLKSMINEKRLKINFNMEDEAVVLGDEKRIEQVIINLYTNAIKYTPLDESINVQITASKDNSEYIFTMENKGIILSEEELNSIWDSFYRGEKSRNKKYGGTGLGLAITKVILELHKSSFGIKNGKNSVIFYFSLERCQEY